MDTQKPKNNNQKNRRSNKKKYDLLDLFLKRRTHMLNIRPTAPIVAQSAAKNMEGIVLIE